MKALEIIDREKTILMEKCTLIKLLHWTDLTKKILVENIELFYKDIFKNL